MPILNNITEAVGNTPLVKLNQTLEGGQATIALKLEFQNPAASVKDRIGVAIIDAAEASGQLQPGGTIVDVSGVVRGKASPPARVRWMIRPLASRPWLMA